MLRNDRGSNSSSETDASIDRVLQAIRSTLVRAISQSVVYYHATLANIPCVISVINVSICHAATRLDSRQLLDEHSYQVMKLRSYGTSVPERLDATFMRLQADALTRAAVDVVFEGGVRVLLAAV